MNRNRSITAPGDKLYTSSQVLKMLGISSSTLLSLVDKGVILKITPPGKKQGFYTKESVEEYTRQQELFLEAITTRQKMSIITRKATIDDELGIFEMEQEVLGLTVPLETRMTWLERNPDIDFIVTDGKTVYGHLSLLPFDMDIISKLLKGQIRGWQIPGEAVLPYRNKGQYNLFVMAFAVRNNGEMLGHQNGALLLREAERTLAELANKGILVRAIYATSRTRDGIYLSTRMGFENLKDMSNGSRLSFKLDMGTNQSKFAENYRQTVKELQLPQKDTSGIV